MSDSIDITEIITAVRAMIKEECVEELKEGFDNAKIATLEDLEEAVRSSYMSAVSAFYSDYPNPRVYSRNESLIGNADTILMIDVGSGELDIDFNEYGITAPYVWHRVFEGGWHGGSTYWDRNQEGTKDRGAWHDEIDDPEGPYIWPNFKPAKRMSKPPLELMQEGVNKWIDEEFEGSVLRHLREEL